MLRSIRIFISSPGDVAEEREKARQVVAALDGHYGDRATLKIVMWEDLALDIDLSAQQSIEKELVPPEKVPDVAVFILWSRLGSELSEEKTARPGGGAYRSGTEHEFELMLRAREESGGVRPRILAYFRDDEKGFLESLKQKPPESYRVALEQKESARRFVEERFMDARGRNIRGLVIYGEPVTFAQRLDRHLRQVLDEILATDQGAATWNEAPYRGLEAFDIRHAPIFCGRDEETCGLLQRLREREAEGCAFVCLVGASGSGKSSLARAGVAATLIQRSYDDGVREWRAAVFVPGLASGDLGPGLARVLAGVLPELGEGKGGVERFARTLGDGNHEAAAILVETALGVAAGKLGGGLRVLLVLDQMEELWTDRSISPEHRENFLRVVEALARDGRFAVLATLRSDFYPQAQLSEAFLRLKGERGHFDLVPPGVAALREMIVQPARRAGLEFERDERTGRTLDERILGETAGDPSALPLLQYALAELYERRNAGMGQLTFAAYEEMGGVEGALGRRIAATFERLPESARGAADAIFPLLVSVDAGDGQNAGRRRATLADLTATEPRAVLTEALVTARFVITDRDRDGTPTASLAHESLLRKWPLLVSWLDRNRDLLRMRARVEQYHAMWEESDRDASRLLPAGLSMEEGRTLLGAEPPLLDEKTRRFVTASATHQDRERQLATRKRRWAFATLLGLTGVALFAGVAAYLKGREAKGQRDFAESKREEAEEQRALVTAKSEALSATLGNAYFYEGNARLRDDVTAREGLAYLARAVREHGNQTSANRLLTFFQQRTVWVVEEAGAAGERPAPVSAVVPPPRNVEPPSEGEEPGKIDVVVQGPQGQVAASWVEDIDSPKGSGHPGTGLHHFRVWDRAGKPLTKWIKADYESDHWIGNIRSLTFSPDGVWLAVAVERWREPEYLQIWHVPSGQRIGDTIVATGEEPNAQGAAFTLIEFAAAKGEDKGIACDLVAGSSRGDAYWARFVQLNEAADPYGVIVAIARHRTAIRAAYLSPESPQILVTGSADGEIRFTSPNGDDSLPGVPALNLGEAIGFLGKGDSEAVTVETARRGFAVRPIPLLRFSPPVPPRPGQAQTAEAEPMPEGSGTIRLILAVNGLAELKAMGNGRDLVIDPEGIAVRRQMSTPLAKLSFQWPPNAIIAATQDFVYQAFDFTTGNVLSRPIDEKTLFGDRSAASGIEGVSLSSSGTVLMTRSQHWEPPNLMLSWTTLWDCASGEPLCDRVMHHDDSAPESVPLEEPFLDDESASVGGFLVHHASRDSFPLLAEIAEGLAGLRLQASGEFLPVAQSREHLAELLAQLAASR